MLTEGKWSSTKSELKWKRKLYNLITRLRRARLGGARFSAVWPLAQPCSHLAPHSLPKVVARVRGLDLQKAMPRYFGLQRLQKSSKRIFGFNTTSSPAFRTARNRTAVEISLTTTPWRNSTETWINTS